MTPVIELLGLALGAFVLFLSWISIGAIMSTFFPSEAERRAREEQERARDLARRRARVRVSSLEDGRR